MKQPATILFALALVTSQARAQTNPQNELPSHVATARCAYTTGQPCETAKESRDANVAHPETAQAQFPGRPPGPPFGPPRMMPRPYGSSWFEPDSGNHAALGALIGFGVGAAIGASAKSDGGSRGVAAVLVGSLGAVFGAAIGHSIPAFHHYRRRYDWPDDDEEARSQPPKQTHLPTPAAGSQPADPPTPPADPATVTRSAPTP